MKKNLVRINYDKEHDEFQVLISTDGGEEWGLCAGTRCQRSEKNSSEDEPMYIHCGLIDELKKCLFLGYEMVF